MKKYLFNRMVLMLLVVVALCSVTSNAFAAGAGDFAASSEMVSPRYAGIKRFTADLTIESSGRASCQVIADLYETYTGKHVVFQVKNNGTAAQTVKVDRVTTIADNRTEPFTRVTLAPGETLTRAFSISSDSSRLERTLKFGVIPSDLGTGTDVTVSLMQYK